MYLNSFRAAIFLLLFNFIAEKGASQNEWIIEFGNDRDALEYFENYENAICAKNKITKDLPYYLVTLCTSGNQHILRSNPTVVSYCPNAAIEMRAMPNDPLLSDQWGIEKIDVENAWNEVIQHGKTIDGKSIVIAVVDFGYELSHEDLSDNIWTNNHEIEGDGIDNDNNGYIDDINGFNAESNTGAHIRDSHGNRVSGIIGAKGDNGSGVSGINWDIEILPISGATNVAKIVAAYGYIYSLRKDYNESNGTEGAYIVATNLSQGIPMVWAENYTTWCGLYDIMGNEGILSVGSTDNADYNVDEFGDMPSTCDSDFLITVTSSNRLDRKSSLAAYGPIHVDIAAPGEEILSTGLNNEYKNITGASAAAPHVAGAIGLLYTIQCESLIEKSINNPPEAALTVRSAILQGAKAINGFDTLMTSGGRLDIFNSIQELAALCGTNSSIGESLDIVKLEPNPVQGQLHVEYSYISTNPINQTIYDSSGRLIQKSILTPSLFEIATFELNLQNFATGVYFLVLQSGDNKVTKRFIKI